MQLPQRFQEHRDLFHRLTEPAPAQLQRKCLQALHVRESQTRLNPLLPASGEVDRLDGVLAGEPVTRERPAELDFADGVPEVGRDGGSQVCQRPGIAEFKGVERVEHIDRLAVAEHDISISAT